MYICTMSSAMDYIKEHTDKYIEVQLGVLVFQEEDSYLAFCPALNLSTYGESISDVKDAFDDVLTAYIEECTKMGTLEKDLLSHGWTLQVTAGKAEPPNAIDLNIPAGMLRQQFNEPFRIPLR
jgi:hypothetical protein